MLSAISDIGILAGRFSQGTFLENLAMKLSDEIGGKKQHVALLDFSTDKPDLQIKFAEVTPRLTEKEYLWIGNADGNNSPQWYLTTNNLAFILSQTIPNILSIMPEKTQLHQKAKQVLKNYFFDTGVTSGTEQRYRYMLNLELLPGYEGDKLADILAAPKKPIKKVGVLEKNILKWLNQCFSISDKEISLYVVLFDGMVGVRYPEYMEKVQGKKVGELFEKERGICSVCGKEGLITGNTSRMKFKYYITDKIGFANNLNKDAFHRHYSFCRECYKNALLAETFISNNFSSCLGSLNLYIIPGFLNSPSLTSKRFHNWVKYVPDSINVLKGLVAVDEMETQISDYLATREFDNELILNLMFYQRNKAELKVLKMVKDVPPTRFKEIALAFMEVNRASNGAFLAMGSQLALDLSRLYYLIPLRQGQRKQEYQKFLAFIEAVFDGRRVSTAFLIKQYLELFKVYAFNKGNFNVKPGDARFWDVELAKAGLRVNYLNCFLKKVGVMEMTDPIEIEGLRTDENRFIKAMGYNSQQSSLFILGYLVAEVANAQYSSNLKSKPVLNKIAYQGMSTRRVVALANEVFDKLRQYKKLDVSNEKVLSVMKQLMDREMANWSLSDKENVFYLLSGYSYLTGKVIDAAKQKGKGGANDDERVNQEKQ